MKRYAEIFAKIKAKELNPLLLSLSRDEREEIVRIIFQDMCAFCCADIINDECQCGVWIGDD